MTTRWIAARVIREIVRDRRTLAFFLLAPVLVMTLVYFAIAEDEVANVAVVARGAARLYETEVIEAIENEGDIELIELDIDDDETDPEMINAAIVAALRSRVADGVLYMTADLITDRFDGKRGELIVHVEGTRPTISATVLSGIASAMDDLASVLPVVIDAECSQECADSVNVQPMDMVKHYLHGSDDYRMIDYFLPVFPPFFVFFFTFVISTVTFQRERVRGTLERLLIAPVSFHQVVFGYVGGFFIFATAQSAIIMGYFLALIELPLSAVQIVALFVLVVIMMLIALMSGLLASFVAQNEFQAIQFIPLVILPQLFLGDVVWSIETFPPAFRAISYVLPLTHMNIAMRDVVIKNQPLWQAWPQLAILGGMFVVILGVLMLVGRRAHRAI